MPLKAVNGAARVVPERLLLSIYRFPCNTASTLPCACPQSVSFRGQPLDFNKNETRALGPQLAMLSTIARRYQYKRRVRIAHNPLISREPEGQAQYRFVLRSVQPMTTTVFDAYVTQTSADPTADSRRRSLVQMLLHIQTYTRLLYEQIYPYS